MALKSGRLGANMHEIDWKTGKIKRNSSLSPATTETLGGVIVGTGLIIDTDGVLSVVPYELPTASESQLGGIKIGSRLSIDENGVLSANDQSYSLPIASANQLGGVKIGSNLSIDANGVLTVSGGSMARYISGFWHYAVNSSTIASGENNIMTTIPHDNTKAYFVSFYSPNEYDSGVVYGFGVGRHQDSVSGDYVLVIGCRRASAPLTATTVYFDVMEITYPTT